MDKDKNGSLTTEIQSFDCGLYRPFECTLKRKYSQDRSPVILPPEFTCLIVPADKRDEALEILSNLLRLVSPQDNR